MNPAPCVRGRSSGQASAASSTASPRRGSSRSAVTIPATPLSIIPVGSCSPRVAARSMSSVRCSSRKPPCRTPASGGGGGVGPPGGGEHLLPHEVMTLRAFGDEAASLVHADHPAEVAVGRGGVEGGGEVIGSDRGGHELDHRKRLVRWRGIFPAQAVARPLLRGPCASGRSA